MRISDWSSDVCSSDLPKGVFMIKSNREAHGASTSFLALGCVGFIASAIAFPAAAQDAASADEGNATRLTIGRASCRERVCQEEVISVVAGSLKKTENFFTSHMIYKRTIIYFINR